MVSAVTQGHELRRKEMYQQELPVANLAALTANLNRDPKKHKKPYTPQDFSFFAATEDQNLPDLKAASAYMHLIEKKQLPNWALFIFREMKRVVGDLEIDPPRPVAAIGPGVLLIAPVEKNGGLEGLLIAKQEVAGKLVRCQLEGYRITLAIPAFTDQIIAREHVHVPVTSS